jgi:hypothetical protein
MIKYVLFAVLLIGSAAARPDDDYKSEHPEIEGDQQPSCSSGYAGTTDYGADSYASTGASWSCHDTQYHGLSYSHGCGGKYDSCDQWHACTGTCCGYKGETISMVRNGPDADATLGAWC